MPSQTDPNSELPPTVQALKNLERQTIEQPMQPNQAQANASTNNSNSAESFSIKLKQLLEKLKQQNMGVKIAVVCAAIFVLCAGLTGMVYLTSADTRIFKLSLNGIVLDENQKPIANATIKLDDATATSNINGEFVFNNLEIKRYNLEIDAEGFENLRQEIVISRSFLVYENNRTFQLKTSGIASIVGKLVSPDPAYKFLDDELNINSATYKPSGDGRFEISNLKTGQTKLIFSSVNFRDLSIDVDLKGGKLDLNEIQLTPAGDIVGSVQSWLREDLVTDLKITVEGVPAEQIIINEKGEFSIKDLEVAKKYKIRTQKQGYISRDYEVGVNQGSNQIFNFKVVEIGKMVFVRKVNNRDQLFISNYDGSDAVQVSNDTKLPVQPTIKGNTLLYFSSRDNLTSSLGGNAYVTYSGQLDPNSAAAPLMNRESDVTTNLGRQVVNFYVPRIVNIYRGKTQTERVMELTEIDFSNRPIYQTLANGTFGDVLISNDGKTIYFYMQDATNANNTGAYYLDVTDKPKLLFNREDLKLLSTSSNGNLLLYSARNKNTGLVDLMLYNRATGQDTTLKQAFTGADYQFVNNDNDVILYTDVKDGFRNVFQLKISQNRESSLTAFKSTDESLVNVYQQDKLIVYQTNKGIYLMDITQPRLGKLLTNNFSLYTPVKL